MLDVVGVPMRPEDVRRVSRSRSITSSSGSSGAPLSTNTHVPPGSSPTTKAFDSQRSSMERSTITATGYATGGAARDLHRDARPRSDPRRARRGRSRRSGRPRRRAVPARALRGHGRDRPGGARRRADRHARARSARSSRARSTAPSSGARLRARRSSSSTPVPRPTPSSCSHPHGEPRTALPDCRDTGPRGVLTSDSTRIDGLVSLADVANRKLEWSRSTTRSRPSRRLERRIERNDRWRMPLTFVVGGLAYLAAAFAPRLAPRVFLVALAANLWIAGWWVVALVALAGVLLPLGFACAAVLAAYLLVLGLDPKPSPSPPSARRRPGASTGSRTCSRRCSSSRRSSARGCSAGSGSRWRRSRSSPSREIASVPMAAACSCCSPGTRCCSSAPRAEADPRQGVALAAAVIAVALALVGIDAALGGSSHVTEAVRGRPRLAPRPPRRPARALGAPVRRRIRAGIRRARLVRRPRRRRDTAPTAPCHGRSARGAARLAGGQRPRRTSSGSAPQRPSRSAASRGFTSRLAELPL